MRKWWTEEYPEPLSVTLYRDSLTTPWGFRIAGGLDFGQTPVVVTQVNVCSPADGQLQVGDIVISVDHQQVFRRRHFDVLSMLASEAGGSLELQVYRGATAEEIKGRSGFNIRFHAPLSYFPVNCSTSWHPDSTLTSPQQQDASPGIERPNNMYRTVYAGGSNRPTTISLRRQNPYQQSPSSMTTPSPGGRSASQLFFNPTQDEYMLQKVQQSLDALTLGRQSRLGDNSDLLTDPDYNYVPIADKRRAFNQSADPTSPSSYLQQHNRANGQHRPRNHYDYMSRPARAHSVGPGQRGPSRGMTPSSYSAFIRPRSSMGQPVAGHSKVPEFCWMPRGFRPRRGYSQPTRAPPPSVGTYYPQQQQQYSSYQAPQVPEPISQQTVFTRPSQEDANYVPPWKGTLHSASPSAWIEGQMIDPDNPLYHRDHRNREQPKPAEPVQVVETKESEDGRKVVHLQFNSPLQLYSHDAATQALENQIQGGPEGTIMIKGGRPGAPPQKITESTVYKMVHDEDLRKQRRLQRGNQQGQPRQSSANRQRHPSSGAQNNATASASGQLKVVLSQPPQHYEQNYFSGSAPSGGHHQHHQQPAHQPNGFSDF